MDSVSPTIEQNRICVKVKLGTLKDNLLPNPLPLNKEIPTIRL